MDTKWKKLPIMCWSLTLYKEDDKGKQKFYEYTGDHSFVLEGIENEYLNEIEIEKEIPQEDWAKGYKKWKKTK